jgi:transcriptional regulator with XRE-family HTH domain
MDYKAIPEKLKEFRKAKGLSQDDIASLLNMEQTTYSKKELGKSLMSFQTVVAISKIIEKNIEEFAINTNVINNLNDCTLNNSSVSGDIVYNNCTTPIPDRIIKTLEDLITLVKENFKKTV